MGIRRPNTFFVKATKEKTRLDKEGINRQAKQQELSKKLRKLQVCSLSPFFAGYYRVMYYVFFAYLLTKLYESLWFFGLIEMASQGHHRF